MSDEPRRWTLYVNRHDSVVGQWVEVMPVSEYERLRVAALAIVITEDDYRKEWQKPHPDEGLPGPFRSSRELERTLVAKARASEALRAVLNGGER